MKLRPRQVAITLLLLFPLVGCREDRRPALQTVKGPENTNSQAEVKPPTKEEREEALQRLGKAIAAHGGASQLQKMRVCILTLKGVILTPQGFVPLEQECLMQLPERFRVNSKFLFEMGPQTNSLIIDGKNGWVHYSGETRDMTPLELNDTSAELALRRVWTLLPLAGEEYQLRPIEGVEFQGKPTTGIRVELASHLPVDLYFSTETNLLVRSVGPFNEAGRTQLREVQFLDHKPFDGVMIATRTIDLRDGQKVLDCANSFKFVNSFEEKEFTNLK